MATHVDTGVAIIIAGMLIGGFIGTSLMLAAAIISDALKGPKS